MKTAGIIAEYNPFHHGHAWQLHETRRNGATHIAVVMSGCFTQRGEGAFFSKAARAEAALKNGADLILELPVPWACASAQTFASGAVGILDALGCVEMLSFGSESGDVGALKTAARLLSESDGSVQLSQALKRGAAYPRAREAALRMRYPDADLSVLQHPNDTLAIEYLRALGALRSPIKPFAVRRRGAPHDAMIPDAEGYASASFLRGLLSTGQSEEALSLIPPDASAVFRRELESGGAPFQKEPAELMALAQLRRLSLSELGALPDVTEGLENRIFRAVRESSELEELCFRIKTKRYTMARIRRILIAALLGLRKQDSSLPPPYLRVLGFNARGREILAAAKYSAKLPIVTRHADLKTLGERAQRIYRLECLSSDLYGLCLPHRQPGGVEQKYSPIVLDG